MAIKNLFKKCMMIFLAFAFLMQVASANNCTALYNYGDSANRADIVVVGHGWLADDLDDFANETKYIVDSLLTYPTYSNYSRMINIWYVNQSADLGCAWTDPINHTGTMICDSGLSMALALQCPYDRLYVFVNDSGYSGYGGPSIAVATRSTTLKRELLAHEMGGHSFGELMDEYSYGGTGSYYYSGANCANSSDANYVNDATPCTKWGDMPGTGCYAVCSYTNLYRPTYNSIMRNLANKSYNAPSQKQIEKMIDKFANLTKNYSQSNEMKAGESQMLSFEKVNSSDSFSIKWYVNGTENSTNENQTSITFSPQSAGNYTITVNSSFININESHSWNIKVNVTNRAPNITAFSPIGSTPTMNENSSFEFSVTAEDADNDTLSYLWKLDGTEKSTSALWNYNPGFSDAGNYNVTVTVSDGKEAVMHSWNLTVQNVNRAPVLDNIPNQRIPVDEKFMLVLTAADDDGDIMNYYANSTDWIIAKLNNDIAIANWTPTSEDMGYNYFEFKVSDGDLNDSQVIEVEVYQPNRAPNITAFSPIGSNPEMNENSSLEFSVTAEDADNNTLTYKWLLDGVQKSTSQNWTYTPNFSDSGSRNITAEVSDGSLADYQYWNVTVNNVNRAPVLDAISDKSIRYGKELKFNITAYDSDSDSLDYASNMTGMTVNKINNNIAEISWTPGEIYIGDNYIEFNVTDGSLNDLKIAKITVNPNNAPEITSVPETDAEQEIEYTYDIIATDADNDSLSYSLLVYPEGMTLIGSSVEWTPSLSQSGDYAVKLAVNDSIDSAEQEFNISVAVNHAPVLDDISDKEINEGQELVFAIAASDEDDDILEYDADEGEITKINNTLAEFSWTPGYNDAGVYYFNISATDAHSISDTKTVKITVNNANRAPVLQSISDITAYEGDIITITPSATDADNDSLAYTYSGWMASNSKATGYSDAGAYAINVTASDGNLSDTKTVNVNVLNSYQIRMAVSDKLTKARLTGTVTIDGASKSTDSSATATFDYVHAGDHSITYSASGYKSNSYTVNLDNNLAGCSLGSNCTLTGASCKWNAAYSDFTCLLSNQFMFVFNPSQNAIKNIDYLVK